MSRKAPPRKAGKGSAKARSAPPAARPNAAQKYLLPVCVGTAIASTGLVAYLVWRGPDGAAAGETDLPATPDLRTLGINERGGVGTAARGLSVEFTDKDDPTRLRGTLTSATIKPLREQTYEVEDPRVWMFEDDGRFVYLEAPAGRLVMPDGKNPQSGAFSGGVTYKVFESRPDGVRPDPAKDAALISGTTPSFQFDLSVGEGYAPGEVHFATPELEFKGTGVKVVFDEVRDRLKYLEVRTGGWLKYTQLAQNENGVFGGADLVNQPERRGPERTPNRTPPTNPGRPAQGLSTGNPTSSPREADPADPADERRPRNVRTHYRLTFLDAVQLKRGPMEMSGDKLEAWALVVNNKLPADAFGGSRSPIPAPPPPPSRAEAAPALFIPLPTGAGGGGAGGWNLQPAKPAEPERRESLFNDAPPNDGSTPAQNTPSDQPAGGPPPQPSALATWLLSSIVAQPDAAGGPPQDPGTDLAESRDPAGVNSAAKDAMQGLKPGESVELTWTGRLVVEPLASKPQELAADHVSLRFSADRTGLVRFQDKESGAFGQASTVDYAATQQVLALASPGLNAVRLTLPESGRVECNRVELALGAGTGIVRGPGQVTGLEKGQTEPDPHSLRRLAWTDQADFQFRMDGTRMTGELQWARFEGGIRVGDQRGNMTSRVLTTWFGPASEGGGPRLQKLLAQGNVSAADSEKGSLTAPEVEVTFRPDGATDAPRAVTASGGVIVRREDAEFRSQWVDTTLMNDDEGRLTVERVIATGEVRYSATKNRVRATTDRLEADARFDLVTLLGPGSIAAQGESEIEAAQITLSGSKHTMDVFGAGEFRQLRPATEEPGEPLARVNWTSEMNFRDDAGQLECYGGVVAVHHPEPLATEVIEAERVFVGLTPRGGETPSGLTFRDDKGERQVLSVHAIGASELIPGGRPVVVQMLHEGETPDLNGKRPIVRLLRLEAPEANADNIAGTLRVDKPGRLWVADFSEVDPERPGEASKPGEMSDVRGSALFEWHGFMKIDRPADLIEMHDRVAMVHRRMGDGRTTNLNCDTLVAAITEEASGDVQDAPAANGPDGLPPLDLSQMNFRLRNVVATGEVHLISESRELIAARVDYDAATGTADATAAPGDVVTFYDTKTPAPVTASRLWWDLMNNRIEIKDPGPVVTPRRGP